MAVVDPTVPASPGNPSGPLNSADTIAPKGATGVVGISSGDKITPGVQYYSLNGNTYQNSAYQAPTTASTTTVGNGNKINQVPGIQNTTSTLANGTGVKTDPNGNATYANGTIVNTEENPASSTAPQYYTSPPNLPGTPGYDPSKPTTTTASASAASGGYIGDVYYPPGATLPLDANGQPQQLSTTSTTDKQILDSLNSQKAQSDSLTASIIDNIKAQYEGLITQQKQANAGQEASVNTALLRGGVTGQGSSAQYDPQGSANIIQSQISYGLGQIADLQSKENMAIIQAQQAGQNEDFQLQDKINQEISSVRDQKVAAATKLNDTLNAAKAQNTLDTAVNNLFNQGIKDPQAILDNLNKLGVTGPNGVPYTASDIAGSIKALTPVDQANIQSLAAQAAAAGADAATVAKISNSTDYNSALALATPALGADHADKLKQEAITNQQNAEQIAISQQNANTAAAKLKDDESAASKTAANAVVTTTSGKTYVDGTNLDPAGKTAALNAGLTVLNGDSAKAMTILNNTQEAIGTVLSSLQSAGVIDDKGNFTGKGATFSLKKSFVEGGIQNNAAGTAEPSLTNFANNISTIITSLKGLPNTGNLVVSLQDNTPSYKDDATTLKTKLANITNAIENSENSFLANGNSPHEGSTGTINGQSVIFKNGNWQTQ